MEMIIIGERVKESDIDFKTALNREIIEEEFKKELNLENYVKKDEEEEI